MRDGSPNEASPFTGRGEAAGVVAVAGELWVWRGSSKPSARVTARQAGTPDAARAKLARACQERRSSLRREASKRAGASRLHFGAARLALLRSIHIKDHTGRVAVTRKRRKHIRLLHSFCSELVEEGLLVATGARETLLLLTILIDRHGPALLCDNLSLAQRATGLLCGSKPARVATIAVRVPSLLFGLVLIGHDVCSSYRERSELSAHQWLADDLLLEEELVMASIELARAIKRNRE